MGAVSRILLQEKQTDLLTPNGARDSKNVSGVSREQIRLLNLNIAVEFSHGVTEAQRRFTAGALPQTPTGGQSQAIDWRQIIFYTLYGQTSDLKIEPPMLCVSVTLCETPLPACGWRVRGGSETVVKRHLRAVGVPVSSAGARKWVHSRNNPLDVRGGLCY